MLNSFAVFIAKFPNHAIFVLIVKVKVAFSQLWILLNHFIQNIDVKWQPFRTFKLLNKFSTYRTSNAIFMMKFSNTICTQSMSTMDENSGNSFSNVVLEATKLTYI